MHREEASQSIDLPRFTLGAVTYIDALESYEKYLEKSQKRESDTSSGI